MKKAIVLLSGGIDSAVTLYMAREKYDSQALIFNYGQKASKEIRCAGKIAESAGCGYKELNISFPWKGSALLEEESSVPEYQESPGGTIPSTYVPGRNIIFLSYGVSFAEAIGADAVFIGAHQLDYSNYPDCRSEFFDSFREMVSRGTKRGSENDPVEIVTPIIDKTKSEIIKIGSELGVPFEYTWSCYNGAEKPCGVCESCMFRAKGFAKAGIKDPLLQS